MLLSFFDVQMSLTVVSRYMVRTLLWFSLERDEDWAPETLSSHVLRLLDTLVTALRSQRHRSYFFPRCNVMLHAASAGRNHSEEDYLADAEVLETFIRHLYQESLPQTFQPEPEDEDFDELESNWILVYFSFLL